MTYPVSIPQILLSYVLYKSTIHVGIDPMALGIGVIFDCRWSISLARAVIPKPAFWADEKSFGGNL